MFFWPFTFKTFCHRTTHETESKDSLKNSSSAEQQSYSNPIREEYDLKSAKYSETSEEKRAKLREIEVHLNAQWTNLTFYIFGNYT